MLPPAVFERCEKSKWLLRSRWNRCFLPSGGQVSSLATADVITSNFRDAEKTLIWADGWSYSESFGWAILATTTQVIRLSGSGQYQIRPAEVISYCHCSSNLPDISRLRSCPRSRCWREGFSGVVGRSVRTTHASHVFDRAARQSSSQPLAASDVAKRASQPPGRPGGANRSPRFGTIISLRLGREPRRNRQPADR